MSFSLNEPFEAIRPLPSRSFRVKSRLLLPRFLSPGSEALSFFCDKMLPFSIFFFLSHFPPTPNFHDHELETVPIEPSQKERYF